MLPLAAILALSGCASATDVMPMGSGVYMISSRAAPARGGAAGALQVAFRDANAYCVARGGRAVVIEAADRDVHQSAFGGGFNRSGGSFSGGSFAAGNASLRFRCET
jgi:hypothetical protein